MRPPPRGGHGGVARDLRYARRVAPELIHPAGCLPPYRGYRQIRPLARHSRIHPHIHTRSPVLKRPVLVGQQIPTLGLNAQA